MSDQNQFHPAPGYILGRPLKREEIAELTKASASSLSLPDNTGKQSDGVGVAEVIEIGSVRHTEQTGWEWPPADKDTTKGQSKPLGIREGDFIAYIPFTDALLSQGYERRNIVPYRSIMATMPRKGDK